MVSTSRPPPPPDKRQLKKRRVRIYAHVEIAALTLSSAGTLRFVLWNDSYRRSTIEAHSVSGRGPHCFTLMAGGCRRRRIMADHVWKRSKLEWERHGSCFPCQCHPEDIDMHSLTAKKTSTERVRASTIIFNFGVRAVSDQSAKFCERACPRTVQYCTSHTVEPVRVL